MTVFFSTWMPPVCFPATRWPRPASLSTRTTAEPTESRPWTSGPVNQPPMITSTPVSTATQDTLYSYDVNASDPDATPISQIAKLTASDSDPDDVFGWFVDMGAGNAIVGNFPFGPGTAYLYDTTSSFTETILPTPGGTTFDNFYASSVAISGNTALAGAPGNTDTTPSMPSGEVYTFDVSLGTSTKIVPMDTAPGDEYGFSLGLDGTTSVVGATNRGNQGAAYLINASTGAQIAKRQASDGYAGDNFGYSVDIDGNNVVIGAPNDETISGNTGPGAVYVYDISGGAFGTETKITPSTNDATRNTVGDEFGWSTAIDGNKVAVGAPNRGVGTGAAYVYTLTDGTPTELILTPPPTSQAGDDFGYAVDILGDFVLVGSPADDDPNSGADNKAYLYNANTGALIEELVCSDCGTADEYGFSVALWDKRALVGAPFHDLTGEADAGAAYLFNIPENVGDMLMFSLDAAPSGMTMDSNTGLIQWTPTNAQVGSNDVTVRVTDSGGLFDTQIFSVNVANVNDAPVITSTALTAATEDQPYSYDVNANDPDVGDTDTLMFSLDSAPSGMTMDSNTGLIQWTPTNAQMGSNDVKVRVTGLRGPVRHAKL